MMMVVMLVTTMMMMKMFWHGDPCFVAGPVPTIVSLDDVADWEKRQIWKEKKSSFFWPV